MRRPREYIYYIGGTLCLVLSAFLLFQSGIMPSTLTNRIYINNSARGYKDYYYSDISLHRNNLRQAAAYLPLYSVTEQADMFRFLASFEMEQATIYETEEFFLAASHDGRHLQIYKFLDKLIYSSLTVRDTNEPEISVGRAKEIAQEFVKRHLFLAGEYEIGVQRSDVGFEIQFVENLGKIPNKAFPTIIMVDNFGNIVSAKHFYFEYEELGRGDLMTAASAIAYLPRNHSGRIRITNYELIYIFEYSILQPVYLFRGYYPDGSPFSATVAALKF